MPQSYRHSPNGRLQVRGREFLRTTVSELIQAMKSYTWGTQSPAVGKLLEADWTKISADEAFVLGRNVYQCACGHERKAQAVLGDLRRELAALPEDRALDFLNGMFFEVYFDSGGEFRGRELKARCLANLLSLQTVKKFAPSIAFIRRALEPYSSNLLFRPAAEPEIVSVEVSIRKTDPPTVRSLKANGTELLAAAPRSDEPMVKLWRLSLQSFTVNELHQQLSEAWGVPSAQLGVACTPTIDPKVKLRLPEGMGIVSPVKK